MHRDKDSDDKRNPYTHLPYDDNKSDKWQLQRRQRLNYICELLEKLGKAVYPQLVGKVAITTGVRSHIIRTYISEIEAAGLITIKGNVIYWNNQSRPFESRV